MPTNDVTGIILAGGKATRMNGIDKGLIQIEGKTIIEILLAELQPIVNEIIIVSNSSAYNFLNQKVCKDIFQNKGPLAGIHSGIYHSNSVSNIIVGCDMPFLSSLLFNKLLKHGDKSNIVTAKYKGKIEPLCGIYNKQTLPNIERSIQNDRLKLTDFVKEQDHYFVEFQESDFMKKKNPFLNLNSLDDLNFI